jgi:hypothetical protein
MVCDRDVVLLDFRYMVTPFHMGDEYLPDFVDCRRMYWPISLVWMVINDPVKKVFTTIYQYTGKVYDTISAKVMGEISVGKANP